MDLEGDGSPASLSLAGKATPGRKARGGFALSPKALPEGDSPVDSVQVPAASRDVRRLILDGHERVAWRCHVADGYNIDFSVKVSFDDQTVIVRPPARVEDTFEGYLDFGGEHSHILAAASSASSSGAGATGTEDRGDHAVLTFDFDNSFSYFTPKSVEFRLSKVGGAPKSIAGYTAAIAACEGKADLARALRLIVRMRDVGLRPDLGIYESLLRVCKASRSCEESVRVLAEMRTSGIVPDAQCYTIAIATCESDGQAEMALQLMDQMESDAASGQDIAAATDVTVATGDAAALAWLDWALEEANRQCPEKASELRGHLQAAHQSLKRYMIGLADM